MECRYFYDLLVLLHISLVSFAAEFTFPLSGDEGRFSSPNYPNQYPLNATCTWTIESSTDKRIEIHFVDFRLEKNKRCLYDYLEIREIELHTGKPSTKNAIRYCGYNKPPNYISKGNKVQITFRSDPMSQVDKGFMASWRLLDKDHVDSMKKSFLVPSRCETKTMTVTVMKTKSCTAPPVTITPTKCLCTKTIKEILRTTVVIDNKIPDVAKDYNPSKKKSLQPSVYIGNRLPQADNNSDMKKLKRKCIPSNSAQMTPSRADGGDRTDLVIAFACLLVILLLAIVILLVIFCRREKRQNVSKHADHIIQCVPQEYSQPRSPDIYYSSVGRPTLRMISGDIIIVPGDKRSHNFQIATQPVFDYDNTAEIPKQRDSQYSSRKTSMRSNQERMAFHMTSPTSDTVSINSDTFVEDTRRSVLCASGSEPESEY